MDPDSMTGGTGFGPDPGAVEQRKNACYFLVIFLLL
jgi:hypothetical protein